jgi:hypothetical protein
MNSLLKSEFPENMIDNLVTAKLIFGLRTCSSPPLWAAVMVSVYSRRSGSEYLYQPCFFSQANHDHPTPLLRTPMLMLSLVASTILLLGFSMSNCRSGLFTGITAAGLSVPAGSAQQECFSTGFTSNQNVALAFCKSLT